MTPCPADTCELATRSPEVFAPCTTCLHTIPLTEEHPMPTIQERVAAASTPDQLVLTAVEAQTLLDQLATQAPHTALWAVECHEEVTRGGRLQPCNRGTVGLHIDPEGHAYAVCTRHVRAPMVTLWSMQARIRADVAAGR